MSAVQISNLTPERLDWSTAERLFRLRCRAQNVSPGTITHYGYTLKALAAFLAEQGTPPPAEVKAVHLRGFLEHCRDRGLASETIDSRYRHLRTYFGFLRRDGLLFSDPTEGVGRPKVERRLIRPVTPEQLRLLLAQINTRDALGLRDRALILLLADSGLRISEALGLKVGAVDFGANTAVVLGKGGKERRVCWGQVARAGLLQWLRVRNGAEPDAWLFVDRFGRQLKRNHFAHRLKAYTKRAGIAQNRLSCHALRHLFACEFLKGGGDLVTLQRLLGHASLEMVRRYLNQSDDEIIAKARQASPLDRMGPLPGERLRVKLR